MKESIEIENICKNNGIKENGNYLGDLKQK